MTPGLDPTCRLCKEKEETAFHLAVECPRVRSFRSESFKTRFVQVYDENDVLVRVDTNTNITNLNPRPKFRIEWSSTGMLGFLGTIRHFFKENS